MSSTQDTRMSEQPSDLPRKRLPRDGAGSMDFPPEAGAIKRMVGFDDFMEVYAVHCTYRVKTPDILDPGRTVPNMPWSKIAVSNVGASSPIVARIVIQSVEALGNWHLRNGKPEVIKRHLHACKEEALICKAAYGRLKPHYDAAVTLISEGKLPVKRKVVECPSLPNLRGEVAVFLTAARRALQSIGEVFNEFYVPDGKKPLVKNANFEFAVVRLESTQPMNQQFIDYLRKVVPSTKHFVELRNSLEHPTDGDSTVIEDFRLTPKGIAPPSWRRGSLGKEGAVIEEMRAFLEFLIVFCEDVFFFGLKDNIAPDFPLGFEVVPVQDRDIDPECPVRYRVRPLLGAPPREQGGGTGAPSKEA